MATINVKYPTLLDITKLTDPNGVIHRLGELLNQTNEALEDMPMCEGNLPMGHEIGVRTGLPVVAWKQLNQGTQPSKSTSAQAIEQCGIMEAFSQVDEDVANIGGNVGAYRMSEAMAFIEAMNIEMASTLFYGNRAVDPKEFTGFSIRFSSLSAANGKNILSAGGSDASNQTSIWLICWGEMTVFGIYPKGSVAGLEHKDLGVQSITQSDGSILRAYQEQFKWKVGLCVKDWRYVVRIANIDVSNLVAKTNAADLTELMIKAFHRIPFKKMGKPVFYMNRTVAEFLDIQRRDDVQAGGQLKYSEVDGQPALSFRGIPIKSCDAILETEDAVT